MTSLIKRTRRFLGQYRWVQHLYYNYYVHFLTDCYVVSYPKSGRTWLRVMLAKALALHFGYAAETVFEPAVVIRRGGFDGPLIRFTHDGVANAAPAGQMLVQQYGRYRRQKIIFLMRDPRDVIVSYYFHRTRRQQEEYTLHDFIWHADWGIERMLIFMRSWYDHRHVPGDFLPVRYEDLHADTAGQLRRMLNFVGLTNVSEEVVQTAVAYASFDNMKRMTTQAKSDLPARLRPADDADPQSHKVRQGKVGSYRQHIAPEDLAKINRRINDVLPATFGYGDEAINL